MVRELPDLMRRLPTITTQAIVITGTADRVVRPAISEELARRLPDAELRRVPGAGHALPLTDPEPIAAAVTSLVRAATPVDEGR
jgi:magnesium chelatase accessory protein